MAEFHNRYPSLVPTEFGISHWNHCSHFSTTRIETMNTSYADTTTFRSLQDPWFLHSPRLVSDDSAKRPQDEMITQDLDYLRIRTPPSPRDIVLNDHRPLVFRSPSKRSRPTNTPPPMLVPMQRPSKLQKEDKMLFVTNQELSAVRFPSLPDIVLAVGEPYSTSTSSTMTTSATRDLSQIPCPKNIRLMPRRKHSRRYG